MLYDLDNTDYKTIREKEKQIRFLESEFDDNNVSNKHFSNDVTAWLINHQAMLYGEIILHTIKYFEENSSCSELVMFDHVLVDEYQDLNKAEQRMIDLISKHGSLVVIGDDDQSIYSFKHAYPDGIREFDKSHDNCSDHVFTECRRCPKTVIEKASRLIRHNTNHSPKEFTPYQENQIGELNELISETLIEEVNKISGIINTEREKINLCDFLVLAPTRNVTDGLQNKLHELNIPSKSFFKENILKTDQLKKAFSMLNLLVTPEDIISLRYLLGLGGDKFRTKSYRRVLNYASEQGLTINKVLEKLVAKDINIPYVHRLVQIYSDIKCELQKLRASVADTPMKLSSILVDDASENREFIELLNIAICENASPDDIGLDEWLRRIYKDISKLITLPENIIKGDFVKLMSLHSSKGLSAKCVIIIHIVERRLPREPFGLKEYYQKYVEEQRRLFYVAITRCKGNQPDYSGKLIISTVEGKESRFIKELDI